MLIVLFCSPALPELVTAVRKRWGNKISKVFVIVAEMDDYETELHRYMEEERIQPIFPMNREPVSCDVLVTNGASSIDHLLHVIRTSITEEGAWPKVYELNPTLGALRKIG